MRKFENQDSKPITMRDLMSIKRLTVARAKVELRDVATVQDAKESVEIYKKSLESIGLDLTTVGEKQSVKTIKRGFIWKSRSVLFFKLSDNK